MTDKFTLKKDFLVEGKGSIKRSNTDSSLKLNLNTLQLVEEVCSSYHNISLEGLCIIGAQHILPTTLRMLYSLFNRGLNPRNISLIGKCYSTDIRTYHEMIRIGINVCSSSCMFIKNQAFDEIYKKNLDNFLYKRTHFLNAKKFVKIIVLDDGGELINGINFLIHSKKIGNCNIIGIEQTTAGYEKIKNSMSHFPIVNVARCSVKLRYESPLVATTALNQLSLKLEEIGSQSSKILIVGNGAIGNAFAHTMNSRYELDLCDLKASSSVFSYKELHNILPRYDIVVGCTGKTVINVNDYKSLKKGVILLSLSSSDREFAAVNLRKAYKGSLDCHSDFEVSNITVLNCGFPVNFYGNADMTDPEVFQLTRSLLVAGIMMGMSSAVLKKGLCPLDEEIQHKIADFYHKMSNNSQTLANPQHIL